MNRSRFIKSISISFMIATVFIVMFKFDNEKIIKCENDNYVVNTDAIKYSIDSIDDNDKYISITGYFFELNKELRYINTAIVLQNEEGKLYKLNTNMIIRADVKAAFGDAINYEKSGFNARGKVNMLKRNTSYKVGILYSNEDKIQKLVITDKIIEM